jgi:hypothetical protein
MAKWESLKHFAVGVLVVVTCPIWWTLLALYIVLGGGFGLFVKIGAGALELLPEPRR